MASASFFFLFPFLPCAFDDLGKLTGMSRSREFRQQSSALDAHTVVVPDASLL